MLASHFHAESAFPPATLHSAPRRDRASDGQRTTEALQLVAESLPVQRRVVHAGDTLYRAGQRFTHLHIASSEMYKIVNLSIDGREQIVSLKFRGDWLGFDGIAEGIHDCDASALDTGEVWAVPYAALM